MNQPTTLSTSLPIFSYGILQFKDIQIALLGAPVSMKHAVLQNYVRYRKKSIAGIQGGPGVFSSPDHEVQGHLLLDLDEHAIKTIDHLERNYDRVIEKILVDNSHVQAYVYRPKSTMNHRYTTEPWSSEEFENSVSHYIQTIIPKLLGKIVNKPTKHH